jgi:hypothetical protein
MPGDHPFTLLQADAARSDFAAISDDLEFMKAQLARLPTRKDVARILLLTMFTTGRPRSCRDRGLFRGCRRKVVTVTNWRAIQPPAGAFSDGIVGSLFRYVLGTAALADCPGANARGAGPSGRKSSIYPPIADRGRGCAMARRRVF